MSLRALRVSSLGALVVAAGCASSAAPPRPAQQPTPPPQAYQHPGYVFYNAGGAVPVPAAMPPTVNVADALNLQHLQQAALQPRRCNIPLEVAPGQFVHIDCFPYARIGIAQVHATPLKLNLMRLGKLLWAPGQRASVGGTAGAAGTPQLSNLGALASAFGMSPAGATTGVTAAEGTYPDLVDHRLNGTEGPIKDQGDVGACTSFALSSVLDNSLRRAGQNVTTSPEHLWSHYGIPTMEDAATSNLNKPITTFEALPYSGKEACELMKDTSDDCGSAYNVRANSASSDSSLQAKLRTADASNGHKPVQFEELTVSPPNLDEIVSTLASGADLWTAFNIDSSVFTNSRMSSAVIPDWTVPDGGHALAMVGYRKVNGTYQFLLHNSWGVSWGDKGYAWISQAMVSRWMHLAYKVKTDVDAGAPASPNVPKTDEDCAGDKVLDSVTKQCVGICTDLSHPANGQCPNGQAPATGGLTLPGLSGILPGIPSIPGWNAIPGQPAAPAQPGEQSKPASTAPVWPWPVPTQLPSFLPPPKK